MTTLRSSLIAAAAVVAATASASAQTAQPLTLKEAEARALQSHPQIQAGVAGAQATSQMVTEVRSAYYPTVFGSLTGAGAQDGTRIAAGGLNNPTILDRLAYGVSVSQLITDFGRTADLEASTRLQASSDEEDVVVRRANVLLGVDRAYLESLRAQAILRVAQDTVATRQLSVDQVSAYVNSGLRTSLDLSLARVNLGEAQLLLVQAQNELQASHARLSAAIGTTDVTSYALVDDLPPPGPLPDLAASIQQGMRERPDISRLQLLHQSQLKIVDAQRRLWFPSVSLVGAAGLTPYHQQGLTDRYSALGVNISVPITNGSLYSARRQEATFRATQQDALLRDLEVQITRDVQTAWLDVQTDLQRIALTGDLVAEANDAASLAEQRYNLGLGTFVELTQAQLNQTSAQIQQTTARYEYQEHLAVLRFQTGQMK